MISCGLIFFICGLIFWDKFRDFYLFRFSFVKNSSSFKINKDQNFNKKREEIPKKSLYKDQVKVVHSIFFIF